LTPPVPSDLPRHARRRGYLAVSSRALADYPAGDGWAATCVASGASKVELTATPDGDGFVFTASATATATALPGPYTGVVRVSRAGETFTVETWTLTVTPDVVAAGSGALLTHEERCIPLLEQAIAKRVTVDLKAYTLANRQATREELRDLEALLARYRARVARRLRGSPFETVRVTLGRP
jgi:hypothetical protein